MSTKHSKAAEKFQENKKLAAWHDQTLWMMRAKRDKISREVHFKSVKEAVNAGISMIYQELSPIKELSIAENVFVGRYPKTRAGAIDWKTMYDSCQKIFDRWGLNYNPRTKIKMLKTADIQMIEIIKAISFNAQLVIMDEPTSSISQNEIEMLYDFIRALKRETHHHYYHHAQAG